MTIRVGCYNIEWFEECFKADNSMKQSDEALRKSEAVKNVLKKVDADLLTIIEAPNTTTTTGSQSTVTKLETFASWAGLKTDTAAIGYKSAGRQEIAILYNASKMKVTHEPGGQKGSRSNPPFDGEYYYDTDDDRIMEVYKHYRPPFEARVELTGGGEFYVMGVHAKSKGIFGSVDLVHLERESRRNRLKLFGECSWIRRRIEDWLDDQKKFVVMGDINDGPGMDSHEMKYGRSAVELLMGDVFDPTRVLRNYAGRPKWTQYGWRPSSTRFKDRITETNICVLIDHILASSNLTVSGNDAHIIWNPYETEGLNDLKEDFRIASDHFPVTLDINV
jgi:endonuclease/exonuclease/phosphatase family metal-dependent hydrolase